MADDPTLLAWAARAGRILLTPDVRTIPRFAYDRVRARETGPGVVVIAADTPLGAALEELVLLISASRADEWEDPIKFVPLR